MHLYSDDEKLKIEIKEISELNHRVDWSFKTKKVCIEVVDLDSILGIKEFELVIVLHNKEKEKKYYTTQMTVYHYNGEMIHCYDPPKGCNFYRFEGHSESQVGYSVVCTGNPDKYNRNAWHYGINIKEKVLEKIGLSY